jgi:acyl CoA:acetate/3-ketoacid CoA transferase beta subunit
VATNLGLFEPAGEAFRVRALAPGVTPAAAQALTGAPLVFG